MRDGWGFIRSGWSASRAGRAASRAGRAASRAGRASLTAGRAASKDFTMAVGPNKIPSENTVNLDTFLKKSLFKIGILKFFFLLIK